MIVFPLFSIKSSLLQKSHQIALWLLFPFCIELSLARLRRYNFCAVVGVVFLDKGLQVLLVIVLDPPFFKE